MEAKTAYRSVARDDFSINISQIRAASQTTRREHAKGSSWDGRNRLRDAGLRRKDPPQKPPI